MSWRSKAMASISSATCPYRSNFMSRILIVEARFYAHLNDMLIAGARAALEAAGHEVEVITIPGALEIPGAIALAAESGRSEEHTSELQSLMRISYAVFCLKKKKHNTNTNMYNKQ